MDNRAEKLAEQLSALWLAEQRPPDIFAFLAEHGCVLPELLIPVLATDQRNRWRTDQPLKVEGYIAQLPHLADDSLFKLQLAIGEFTARRDADTQPSIDEYTARFDDISDELRSALSDLAANSLDGLKQSITTTATLMIDPSLGGGSLGRYRLLRILGEGAFGRVYLAFDEELERQVAIKVPTPERFQKPEDALKYLAEARTVANLDHPNIVPVYDLGRTDDGSVYVVSKYIEGCTLEDLIKRNRPDHETTSKWLATVALALHHAHTRRLVHRDVKPGNILLEGDELVPYVADFGLAIREEEYLREGNIAGTPAYMSPEQARGEGHRLTGRSDIFSLGVVLYEMLTGHRPFRGSTPLELICQVTSVEPRPLREQDPSIPAELERICTKALSKRASDRYATAVEMADDLLHWNQTPLQQRCEMTIVPKGLRSFDAEDADFFIDLLPGPRNRSGLPESLQYWKTRIEETDPEKTFLVGLMYGPSGCGKSSLVKAGLIPRLEKGLCPVYLEATPDETEARTLRGLRKTIPDLPQDLGLVDSFVWIRQREDATTKVVVVLDQFEQWLHSHGAAKETDLVKALRHCDGKNLQAIVMVRDDFAMAAARFMDSVDVPIVQGHNFATVDLFDVDHAEKVLIKFGQAFGKLPMESGTMTEGEESFVQSVAAGLAREDKVVSVQISLFAEMVKGKPWTLQTLENVSGTEGIGVNFLEETFASRTANPKHKLHQQAAREVLSVLLPEVGSDIKGHMRSHDELLSAAGYSDRPAEFTDLLRILDGELRLITPTDPEGDSIQGSSGGTQLATRYYQLTHDYLVPSLREWLTRKQRETKRGRAELKLATRAAAWKVSRESKQLPSLAEWLSIHYWLSAKNWGRNEKLMMKRADMYHVVRIALAIACLVITISAYVGTKKITEQALLDQDANSFVSMVQTADFAVLEKVMHKSHTLLPVIAPKLKEALSNTDHPEAKIKLSLALMDFDESQVEFLIRNLRTAKASYVGLLIEKLKPYQRQYVDYLWASIEEDIRGNQISTACALANYDPDNPKWNDLAAEVSELIVQFAIAEELNPQLMKENRREVSIWAELLMPVSKHLNPELLEIAIGEPAGRSQAQKYLATELLSQYASEEFSILHEMIVNGDAKQINLIFDAYKNFQRDAIRELRDELQKEYESNDKLSEDQRRDSHLTFVSRQANAAIALMQFEDYEVVASFLNANSNFELLSQFAFNQLNRDMDPMSLVGFYDFLSRDHLIDHPSDPKKRQSVLFALLLSMGEIDPEHLAIEERDRLVETLSEMYAKHPSRMVHSATGWLLAHWGYRATVQRVDQQPVDYDPTGVREWFVAEIRLHQNGNLISQQIGCHNAEVDRIDTTTSIYFTMLVFPEGEIELSRWNGSEAVKIDGPIAVSDKEINWKQFSPFDGDSHRQSWENQESFAEFLQGRRLKDDEPAFGVNWYEAIKYCRWLTFEAGLNEHRQVYPEIEMPNELVRDGWVDIPLRDEFLKEGSNADYNQQFQRYWTWPVDITQPGFRLLNADEWEYVASCGMETLYSSGFSDKYFGQYEWYAENSGFWSHRTGIKCPSPSGLFDIYGNLSEWTNTPDGNRRTIIGGAFNGPAVSSGTKMYYELPYRVNNVGFRIAQSLKP